MTAVDNTVGSLSEEQVSLIIGSLLGDGAMRCKANALIEFNHSAEQQTYVDWKFRQLQMLVSTPPKLRSGNGGRVTPLTMAVWFMDDGSKSYRAIYLNTQQFDLESQGRLLNLLQEQWGIRASLNRDKTYHRIRIAVDSVQRFRSIVGPHVLPELEYKFPT